VCLRNGVATYLPKSVITGREKIVAMRAFCDGSGQAEQSDVIVLAGVAAEESVWDGFETEWKKILDSRTPRAPYIHMKELVHGQKAFADERGWNDKKRGQLFWDCMMYAQHLDKNKFRTFMCSIDMQCYRKVRASLPPDSAFPSYVDICNKWVPMQIFKWYLGDFHTREDLELHFFFDQNEKFCGPFDNLWRRKKKKSRSGLLNHWEIIKQVTPGNMRDMHQLQLADVLAWLSHRHLTPHGPSLPWGDARKITDGILPFTRKEVGESDLLFIKNWLPFPGVVKDYFENIYAPD
jgi:Protein of unknown function (DUF3800)